MQVTNNSNISNYASLIKSASTLSSDASMFYTLLDTVLLAQNLNNTTKSTTNSCCCCKNNNLNSLDNMLNLSNVSLNIGNVNIKTNNYDVNLENVKINFDGTTPKVEVEEKTINNTSSNSNVNANNIISKNEVTTQQIQNTVDTRVKNTIDLAYDQLGKDYVWGANGPDSFDCSGLTKYIYKKAFGIDLPRVSYEQAKFGKAVDKEDLQPGDLIFFDTMNKDRVSHVGIYVGNNEFIHAANSNKGVIKSSLSGYYEDRYINARRPY
mgnify:CR=1 FL=1